MQKKLKLLISLVAILFFAASTVQADTLQDYENKRDLHQQLVEQIKEDLEGANEKEKVVLEQALSENTNYARSYEKAISMMTIEAPTESYKSVVLSKTSKNIDYLVTGPLKTGIDVIDVANKYINNSKYVFGGGRNQTDIAQGYFDCSSYVHWAYKQIGVDLGALTATSTETLKNKGKAVSADQMAPGDMVFFDTYKTDGHVGIYIGNGQFVGAQSSTGVAVADMSKGYWLDKFNGRVRRI